MPEATLFEKSRPGRTGASIPESRTPRSDLPGELCRESPPALPELSEVDVIRHYTHLSQFNFGIDLGMYPLGSCTMKYNPRVNEAAARLPGFAGLHPLVPADHAQGALRLMYELAAYLGEITGFDNVTLQPAAGAHGEMTGIMIIRAHHESKGNPRKKVLIPDTAHGTNPASSTICGYEVETVTGSERGNIGLADLDRLMTEDVAALMITNPNTLGLFEEEIGCAAEIVHAKGGLLYVDGANLNAIMGVCRPGDFGADVMHINLHKTFSTPHGGGGPGAGPVAVKAALAPFLPSPVVAEKDGVFFLDENRPQSIGRVQGFGGNFGVLVRAYAYIRELGAAGLTLASRMAVLNANYVKESLKTVYHLPFDRPCMHECVFSDKGFPNGVTTMDVAKALVDYGFHPPTVYFPLVVKGAIMIEPTETESLETLDAFIAAMKKIRAQAETDPSSLHDAPHGRHVGRLNEVLAAKKMRLTAEME